MSLTSVGYESDPFFLLVIGVAPLIVPSVRGALLAGARLSADIMPGVIQLATGAWLDLQDIDGAELEVHGNPNALTRDVGTSRLAQGTTAHSCLCEAERYDGALPDIRVFRNPPILAS